MTTEQAIDYLMSTCEGEQLIALEIVLSSKKASGGRPIEFDDDKHQYIREYMRKYRQKHREKIRDYQREYQRHYNKT